MVRTSLNNRGAIFDVRMISVERSILDLRHTLRTKVLMFSQVLCR